jgi:hypothetical protein
VRIHHYETVRQRKDGGLADISLTVLPVKLWAPHKKGRPKTSSLLTREIQHRTGNLFGVVQAVVSSSFAGQHSVKDAEAAG